MANNQNYGNDPSALYDNSNDLILYDDNIYQLSQKNNLNDDEVMPEDILNLAIHKHTSNIYNSKNSNANKKSTQKTKSVIKNLNAFKTALQKLSSKLKKSSTNLDEKSTSKYLDSDVYSSCTKMHPLLHNLESSNIDNNTTNNSSNNFKRNPQQQQQQSTAKTLRKNYLYFNYNNNKMNYFNPTEHDLTFNEPLGTSELLTDCDLLNTPKMMITSTPLISEAIALSMNSSNNNQQSPELLSTSSAKLKRLSDTEV